ncbi:protein ligase NEDD4 [Seminavis robusta]|uniref:HECT-type E3 ubiquitin transferase n=1 Tax=Seminavis robusta TaxID=568900 RepID=A0A9N8F0E8_9STRA|nr:protein ligase NEDD4 [Seminavis robusta]|eukprot:Sro2923_g340300.1 protein ligase NEDD4 (710) ;mRNA; f:1271-3645
MDNTANAADGRGAPSQGGDNQGGDALRGGGAMIDTTTTVPPITTATLAPSEEIIAIPHSVKGGQEFIITRNGQKLKIKCPTNLRGGQKLKIQLVPPDKRAFLVPVPEGVKEGETFSFAFKGQRFRAKCPPNTQPGLSIRVTLPASKGKFQWSETEIKDGPAIPPGKNCMVALAGVRVLVRNNDEEATRHFRFTVPSCLFSSSVPAQEPRITGWAPTFHADDQKFHWFCFGSAPERVNTQYVLDRQTDLEAGSFHPTNSSWVPVLVDQKLNLVAAQNIVMDGTITDQNGKQIFNQEDMLMFQRKDIKEKHEFFCHLGALLASSEGLCDGQVRQSHILDDSMEFVGNLTDKQLKRQWWRVKIATQDDNEGERSDTKAWFQSLVRELLSLDLGIWQQVRNAGLEPSQAATQGNALKYFRVLGRVLGKALIQGCPLSEVNLRDYLFKYLSGCPLDMSDLGAISPSLAVSLCYFHELAQAQELDKFLAMTPLTFTLPPEPLAGITEEVTLVPWGEKRLVTSGNYAKFMEEAWRYVVLKRLRPQLQELVAGIHDVMPHEAMLQLLNPQELKTCLCGFPELKVEEWQQFTTYTGPYSALGLEHPHIQWFWQIAAGMDYMTRMRLLQFVAGIHYNWGANDFRLHSAGFDVLRRRDTGNRQFVIRGLPAMTSDIGISPKINRGFGIGGTCFLELPPFTSVNEMKLTLLSRLDVHRKST